MTEERQALSTTDPICRAWGHFWSGWHLLGKRIPLTWYLWCMFCGTRVKWTRELEEKNWPDRPELEP